MSQATPAWTTVSWCFGPVLDMRTNQDWSLRDLPRPDPIGREGVDDITEDTFAHQANLAVMYFEGRDFGAVTVGFSGRSDAAVVFDGGPTGDGIWRAAMNTHGLSWQHGDKITRGEHRFDRFIALRRLLLDPEPWLDGTPPEDIPDALRHLLRWADPHWGSWAAAGPWAKAGFVPGEARVWATAWGDPVAAAPWAKAKGFNHESSAALHAAGWTVEQGRAARDVIHRIAPPRLPGGPVMSHQALVALAWHTRPDPARGPALSIEQAIACAAAGVTLEEIANLRARNAVHEIDPEALTAHASLLPPLGTTLIVAQ